VPDGRDLEARIRRSIWYSSLLEKYGRIGKDKLDEENGQKRHQDGANNFPSKVRSLEHGGDIPFLQLMHTTIKTFFRPKMALLMSFVSKCALSGTEGAAL